MARCNKIVILVVILLVLIATPALDTIAEVDELGALTAALTAAGVPVRQGALHGWTALPDGELSASARRELLDRIMAKLAVEPGAWQWSTEKAAKSDWLEVTATVRETRITVRLVHVHKAAGAQNSVSVDLAGPGEVIGPEWRARTEEALSAIGGVPAITTCLVGWQDGKLNEDIWMSRLYNAGEILSVAESDHMIGAGFASMSGCSRYLPPPVWTGDKPVNFNMVVRYSPFDNRTYIIVASPVIAGEY